MSPSDFCLADLRRVVYAAGMIPVGEIWRAGDSLEWCMRWMIARVIPAEESRLKIDYECLILFCKIGVSEWIKRRSSSSCFVFFFFFFFWFQFKTTMPFLEKAYNSVGSWNLSSFFIAVPVYFRFYNFHSTMFLIFNFLLNLIPK
jgi:hypothetical protein